MPVAAGIGSISGRYSPITDLALVGQAPIHQEKDKSSQCKEKTRNSDFGSLISLRGKI